MKIYIFCVHEVLEDGGSFVVKPLETGSETARLQHCVAGFVCSEDLELRSRWNGDSINVVAVLVIQYEKVLVAGDGGDG